MKHLLLTLLLFTASTSLVSQTLEETILRDMKQYGYFVEWKDSLGSRMYSVRDREPWGDPETFVATFFVARPPKQTVPPQKSDGRIIIMSEMVEVPDDSDTHTVAMKYALKSDVILHCAGYMSLVQEEGKTMLYLVHRIDEKSYDKLAFKRTLDCMKEEWKMWEEWR